MTGTLGSVNTMISGDTGTITGSINSSGYGEIYGIFINSGNISYGITPHNIAVRTPPTPTGTIYYNEISQFGGSGIHLRFVITAFSGFGGGVVYTGGYDGTNFIGDPFITGLNWSGFNGLAHPAIPSGAIVHIESHQLLPNYAIPNTGAITGAYPYQIQRGGIYPSMLRDNILSINLQITWSASSGDAINC